MFFTLKMHALIAPVPRPQILLPMTTHDLPWEPSPLLSVVILNTFDFIRTFHGALAPRIPLLNRDYIISP
jgi:hypothetical protein